MRGRLEKKIGRQRRKKHIRKHVWGTRERPRLVVFRSLKHIYAQLVDDNRGRILLALSSLSQGLKNELEVIKGKTETARKVGEALAKRARRKRIKRVVFDRNGYHYHGRVKSLADGAREGGLEF